MGNLQSARVRYEAEVLRWERADADPAAAAAAAAAARAPPEGTSAGVRGPLVPVGYSPALTTDRSIPGGDSLPPRPPSLPRRSPDGAGGDAQWTHVAAPP
jgi:hypothetical protein